MYSVPFLPACGLATNGVSKYNAEAGFSPQQMTTAYDDRLLIEKFVTFIRELGHFPIIPELRMKARNDKNFPSDVTFFSRWGTKRQAANKIDEYCKQHKGHEHVLVLCQPILESEPQTEEAEEIDDVTMGYIYLIKSGRYYKIGRSNAVGRREYELSV